MEGGKRKEEGEVMSVERVGKKVKQEDGRKRREEGGGNREDGYRKGGGRK